MLANHNKVQVRKKNSKPQTYRCSCLRFSYYLARYWLISSQHNNIP